PPPGIGRRAHPGGRTGRLCRRRLSSPPRQEAGGHRPRAGRRRPHLLGLRRSEESGKRTYTADAGTARHRRGHTLERGAHRSADSRAAPDQPAVQDPRRAAHHRSGGVMRLYDTARQEVVPFEPGPIVTMYTCGITPYDAAHLGHAATYVTYDVLQRRLRDLGHQTQCVRNVTDIDDPLLEKARQLGVNYLDLAAEEMARFDACMEALGMLPAFSEPRATSAIPDILGFIGMVLDTGYAYRSGGAVYF